MVKALRGFLVLTNYYAEYVPGYAEAVAPLMEKSKANRTDGKKGSKMPVHWTADEVQAFEAVKTKLAKIRNNSRLTQTSPSD